MACHRRSDRGKESWPGSRRQDHSPTTCHFIGHGGQMQKIQQLNLGHPLNFKGNDFKALKPMYHLFKAYLKGTSN